MKKVIEYLRQKIRAKRLNVFLLFLLLAFLISMLSKLSNPITHTLQFKLVPTQLPTRVLLTEKELPALEVTITTSGFNMLKFAFQKFKLNINFSKLQKDDKVYYWNESAHRLELNQIFNSKTIIENVRPANLTFAYATQFAKRVPVVINVQPQFIVGYDLKTPLRSVPDSITIVGPEENLKTIDEVSTEPMLLNAVKTNIDVVLDLAISESPSFLKFSTTTAHIFGEVDKFTEGTVSVPVELVNLPEGLVVSIFPKEIHVVYYTSLSTYDAITADDFRIECDFNTLDFSSNFMIPKLVSYPKTVKTAELQLHRLEYIITQKK